MTRWLWHLFCAVMLAAVGVSFFVGTLASCSQVTATDRAKTADFALDALAAICPSYVAGSSGIPKSPELDRVCVALQPPALTVPIVESRDGGP